MEGPFIIILIISLYHNIRNYEFKEYYENEKEKNKKLEKDIKHLEKLIENYYSSSKKG